jgi:hypothetical protein
VNCVVAIRDLFHGSGSGDGELFQKRGHSGVQLRSSLDRVIRARKIVAKDVGIELLVPNMLPLSTKIPFSASAFRS